MYGFTDEQLAQAKKSCARLKHHREGRPCDLCLKALKEELDRERSNEDFEPAKRYRRLKVGIS